MSENVTEKAKTDLNTRRSMFIAAYLETGNATESAKRAGYSAKCAHSQGMRLLKNAYVKAEVEKRKAEALANAGVKIDEIVRELLRIAKSDVRKLYDENGELLPVKDWPDDVAMAVAGVETDELFEGVGKDREQIGVTKRVRLWDKTKALEMLGKFLKMFVDKVEVDASDDYAKALDRARERVYGVSKKV